MQVISVQSDQRILIGGDFTATSDGVRINLARLHPDGSPDESFVAGAVPTGAVRAIAVQSDGWEVTILFPHVGLYFAAAK